MIGRVEKALRGARRTVSRSEWGARVLRLPRSRGTGTEPGLVLIQIDGLAMGQLERALARGRMPFLRRLLRREGFRLHPLFSGLPSTTPAVQGELFYGVRRAVPAFGFRHRKLGRLVRMYQSDAAAEVEAGLAASARGLLEGGSAWCDIYTGGAAEAHFCAPVMDARSLLRAANPLALLAVIAAHAWEALRVAGLALFELALAAGDLFRGVLAGQSIAHELVFAGKRVLVSVVMRELMTIGASMDAARGLPIVHVNFLGYDEQAHRRGPSSRFAHWSLRGIDDACRRIARAARRSASRHYEIWIYSDHGQARTIPFQRTEGRGIEDAVRQVFGGRVAPAAGPQRLPRPEIARAGWLAGFLRSRSEERARSETYDEGAVLVTGLGPIGHVYPPAPVSAEERERIGRALVEDAHVPLVLASDGPGSATAWTERGRFRLPEDAAEVLGRDHPVLEDVARELCGLAAHPDSGAFVLSGHRPDRTGVTFAWENGSHAGPSRDEVLGFALLPPGAPVESAEAKPYVRAGDLRDGALLLLGRAERPRRVRTRHAGTGLRVMTYNVHSCIGMDGRVSAERIARVIDRYDPDVVALQELEAGRTRTRGVDQAHEIARLLEMTFHFHPAIHVEEERYGDAVLSRLPLRLVRAARLPGLADRPGLEPRGAIWVAIDAGGTEVQVLNTHLGLSRRERLAQVEELRGPRWLGHPDCRDPVILCGDFNDLPGSPVCRRLSPLLKDVQLALDRHRPRATWLGRVPLRRIDHVFAGPDLEVVGIEVPRTEETLAASDHLPLIVEFRLPHHRRAATAS